MDDSFFKISDEVISAIADRRPVVAIECPKEETPARDVPIIVEIEAAVREQGAVPATIVIVDGQVRFGLEADDHQRLAERDDLKKVTNVNLASILVRGSFGAPTVGACLALVRQLGISFLSAGGIGGVHRTLGADADISADLDQLACSPVCVVCSGAKPILDIFATLEYLETRSVPVVGWQTIEFPAYWSRRSGACAPLRATNVGTLAQIVRAHLELNVGTSILVANPAPENAEIPYAEMQQEVVRALESAEIVGVTGPTVTPFLLQEIGSRIGERTKRASAALLIENARLAAKLAVAEARFPAIESDLDQVGQRPATTRRTEFARWTSSAYPTAP